MLTSWTASSLAAACRRLPTLISAALCTAWLHLVLSSCASVEMLCCFITYFALPVSIISISMLLVTCWHFVGCLESNFLQAGLPRQCQTCPECE